MSALTYQDVLDILRLIDSGSFSDIQIEFEGTKVKVTRPAGAAPATAPAPSAPQKAEAPSAPRGEAPKVAAKAVPKKSSGSERPPQQRPVDVPNGVDVKPPMAGTFYSAPSPGAKPYVEVNRAVKKGDQLGIVEVMKLFTPVLAPCDGTVRAILVGNEEFVQSDQALMIIEPAK